MARISVERFLGLAPKIAPHLLSNEQAQQADNALLWSQGLRPIDGLGIPAPLSKLVGVIQTIYQYQGTFLCWTQDVNVVKGPIANDPLSRIYFTGTDKPRVTTSDVYNLNTPGTNMPPASYILGIPNPTNAPVASDVGAGVLNGAYSYVFTYVRKYSDGSIEESGPSPASNVLNIVNREASVTLPNDVLTFADYGVAFKRLYRSTNGSAYFFVTEVAIATTPYVDNNATAALGSAISTIGYLPPPDGMAGMINLPNRCVAAFYQNVVYISEPGQPHAYPAVNRWPVNDTVVAIGNVGTTIVAITQSYPEIGRGVDPSNYTFTRQPALLPCTNKRSAASSDIGVVWACPRGMAGSDGASCFMVTSEFMTEKEWATAYFPSTIHGTMHDGRYYGFFSTGVDDSGVVQGGGFVIDKTEKAYLTDMSFYADALFVAPGTDTLYLAKSNQGVNEVYAFDANPRAPFTYTWKSKEFITEGDVNMAFAQIIADYSAGLSAAQLAALQAQIAAVKAANQAIVADDGVINGVEINGGGNGPDGGDINGDGQTQFSPDQGFIDGTLLWRYYGDGVLVQERVISDNEPFPMPSGETYQSHEFSITGQLRVKKVKMATSIEELAGG